MIEAGRRARTQPPPPAVVWAALTEPQGDPVRPWLFLLADEQPPRILRADPPRLVVWSSLWPRRPDAVVRFDLAPRGAETLLSWTLLVEEPMPDASLAGHLRKRLNELVNRDLRAAFGQ